ncbi:conserved hypothetical protein [Gammaproteobacteria bacterium]
MISENFIDQWYEKAPWRTLAMVEQDLILSRVLVDMYAQPKIKSSLAFRGGTALNKLFIRPPVRYSEDVDLVQLTSEPIGNTLDSVRNVLDPWLGEPKRKLTERSVKLLYRYMAVDNTPAKLKIEINTTEHFHVLPLQTINHEIDSEWFKGSADILTYQLNELMASKLRALYQRRKGRDLFDLWHVIDQNLIDAEQVVSVFNHYSKFDQQVISRAMFEQNLYLKEQSKDFITDISILLATDKNWHFSEAAEVVRKKLLTRLEGESWHGKIAGESVGTK